MATDRTLTIINWIREYFIKNGPDSPAVIGISGGKDSTVVGKLLVDALGPERVIAVKMPQGEQHDIDVANQVIKYLQIPEENIYEINIGDMVTSIYDGLYLAGFNLTTLPQVTSNTPARVRMTILYAIAAAKHGRVANTCNRSENYVGYSTKFGDAAGDFSPLHDYTVREVLQIGKDLGIPLAFLEKPPEDGLSGLTDEANLGFYYDTLDRLLLDKDVPEYPIYKKIETLHARNEHKLKPMPKAPYVNEQGRFVHQYRF